MAERFLGSVNCRIPIFHKCSKCGAIVVSQIPLSESYSGTYKMFAGSRQSQVDEAKQYAVNRMKNTVTGIYKNEPLKCHCTIVGHCASCGHLEIWQQTPKKYASNSLLGTLLGILLLIACFVVPIILERLGLIPVFIIGILGFIYVGSVISKKYPSMKEKSRQRAIDRIPAENRPVFALSLEEMLKKLN